MVGSTSSDDSHDPDLSAVQTTSEDALPTSRNRSTISRLASRTEQSPSPVPSSESHFPDPHDTQDVQHNSDQLLGSLSPAQIYPKYQDNPYAVEPTYFTRPNRYFGPDSTWLSWTEDERTTAASLDRIRTADLSVHLFNAFSLRHESERSRDDDNVTHVATFNPPRKWTAWPLPPSEVPREPLLTRSPPVGPASRSGRDQKPSFELESCLISVATRIARRQWEERQWESKEERTSESHSAAKTHRHSESPDEVNESLEHESTDSTEDGSPRPVTSTSRDKSGSAPAYLMNSTNGVQYFSSQVFGAPSLSTLTDNDTPPSAAEPDKPPVFSADDERFERLLRPSCRHNITNLNDLLRAVHDSRKYYAFGQGLQSRSRSRSKVPSRGEGSDGSESEVAKTNADTEVRKRRGRKGHRRNSSISRKHSLASPTKTADSPASPSPSSTKGMTRSSSATLQPHDWSSVIGLASILGGFAPETIARASERCARLFQQNMSFRTFQEAKSDDARAVISEGSNLHPEDRPWFGEYVAADSEASTASSGPETDQKRQAISVKIIRPCVRCHQSRRKCDLATGLDRSASPRSCQQCVDAMTECVGLRTQVDSKKPEPDRRAMCPHVDCERHTTGFLKNSHLKRHLTVAHKPDATTPRPSRTASSDRHRSNSPAVAERPGIYCPVEGCPRASGGQSFSRGTKLYGHVRRTHPNLAIDEVKKAEVIRRGERRGRWTDDRRRQSRSRDPASSGSRTARRQRSKSRSRSRDRMP